MYLSHKNYKLNCIKSLVKNKKIILVSSQSSLNFLSGNKTSPLNLTSFKSSVNKTKLIFKTSVMVNYQKILSGPIFFNYNNIYSKMKSKINFADNFFSGFLFIKLNRNVYFLAQIIGLRCLKYITNIQKLKSVLHTFIKKNILFSFFNKLNDSK